jgi:hypothetical protein
MLEFMAGLLTGNALLVLLVIVFLIDVTLFAFEEYIWSVVVMTTVLVAGYFFVSGIHDTFVAIGWHRLLTFYVPVYLGVGVATAFLKWTLYNFKRVSAIRAAKKEFDIDDPVRSKKLEAFLEDKAEKGELESHFAALGATDKDSYLTAARRSAFVAFYSGSSYYKDRHKIHKCDYNKATAVVDALTPRANDHKAKFTLWIYQWPIVLADVLLQDFLVKLAHNVARFFDFALSYFSRKMVAHATKGL